MAKKHDAFAMMMAEISDESDDDDVAQYIPNYGKRGGAPKSKPTFADVPKTSVSEASKPAIARFSMDKNDESIENFGGRSRVQDSSGHVGAESKDEESLSSTKAWLMRPCNSSGDPILCYIERDKGFGLKPPVYRCFVQGNDASTAKNGRFIMSAKKKTGSKTSYYLISTDMDADDRGSESVLGKLRGNAVGSQYLITDHGIGYDKTQSPSMLRKELGLIRFAFDSGGPSKLRVWIPSLSSSGVGAVPWQARDDTETIERAVDSGAATANYSSSSSSASASSRLIFLQNKKPQWDDEHGGHVLNFKGRVTESSVKNFQLCTDGGDAAYGHSVGGAQVIVSGPMVEGVVLQFGRVEKNKFNMDLRYPLSIYQAFAICVASMDGKLAHRKGYEYVKKLVGTGNAAVAVQSATSETSAAFTPRPRPGSSGTGPLVPMLASGERSSLSRAMTSLGLSSAGKPSNRPIVAEEKEQVSVQGSITGGDSKSLLPSTEYLMNKISRTFK